MKNGLTKVTDRFGEVKTALAKLTSQRVLVGVPDTKAGRKDREINNAALAYIHDNGAPEVGIPARPFIQPGLASVKPQIEERFAQAGKDAFSGCAEAVDAQFQAVGLIASSAIKSKITEGIPPPLQPSTVANRYRQRGASKRRKSENEYLDLVRSGTPGAQAQTQAGITPLINTGQLRNSITYVLRKA